MGQHTKIEWCDSTLNLEIGCDGCELWNPKVGEKTCYAGQLVERYGGSSSGYPESFDKPKLFPQRMAEAERWCDLRGKDRADKPWLNGMPRLIFLDDMGDTFTESLPLYWLAEHLPRLAALPHIVILLTKRANRMLEFSKAYRFPANFWLLVSVTSAANDNRIHQLMETRGGSVKGISYEPAWGPIDISSYTQGLGWVIAGGSSGLSAKPAHPRWFRDVRDQCVAATVPFFFKQWGEFQDGSIQWGGPRDYVVLNDGRYCKEEGLEAFQQKHRDARENWQSYGPTSMGRSGKKAAGAVLDGREWRQFPSV